jgi:putative ABC transport system substrate-binding protein
MLLAMVGFAASAAAARPEARSAPVQAPRRVVYLNEDNERVRIALEKLRQTLEASSWWRRHPVLLDHVPLNPADPQLPHAISRALQPPPAAIIATSGHVAMAAKAVTRDIPIIFAAHQDPVARGIVSSMQAPEGNVTGLTLYAPVEGKRLELLRTLRREIRTVGVVMNRWWDEDPSSLVFEDAAREQSVKTRYLRADTADQLAALFARESPRVDAFYVSNEPAFTDPGGIVRVIASTGKPAIYTMGLLASRGGFMSYQAILEEPFVVWAKMLGMILDGISPSRIPVEGPRVFELHVNVATARAQQIEIPKSLLLRATTVYESR